MKKKIVLRRSLLCTALGSSVLLCMAPPAFAGDFIFSSGTYVPGTTAPQPLLSGDVLQINAGGNKFFDNSTFTNQSGLVNWNAETLYFQNGAVVNNQSVWDAKSDDALSNNGGATSSFTNSGTFRKSAGTGTTSIGSLSFTNSGTIDAQTGTINFGGGNATFNAGSQFTGAGATVISSNASFNGGLTSANLSLTGGFFTGSSVVVNGSLSFSGGYLQGSWEIASGQSLLGLSGGNKFLNAATLVNNGTVNWQTSDALYFENAASFTNNGLHDIQASSSLVNNGGSLSSYTNSSGATLRVAAGQAANVGGIAFTNNGGTLTANGTLNFVGNNATFNDGTTFNGGGSVLVSSNANFNGTINSGNLILQSGSYTGGAALIKGTVDFTGGSLVGSWELASGQTLNAQNGGNKYLDSASFVNNGTVQWQTSDSLYLQNSSSFDNRGSFNMVSGMALVNNGGSLPSFTNSGTVRLATGQSGSVGTLAFVNNGGTLESNGTLTFGGGNATFNSGTRFTGTGVNVVSNNASFVDDFNSQNLRLTAGSFTGGSGAAGSKVTLSGTVDFTGGYLQGNWDIAAGQTLTAKDGGNKFLNAVVLNNNGTINWQTGDALYLQNGSTLNNTGLFDLKTGAAIVNNGGSLPTFNNTGILRLAAGETASIGTFAFVNSGTITTNGSLNFTGGNATFNAGTQLGGSGVNIVSNNASFNGSFSSTNLSLRNGFFTGGNAVLNGNAEFTGGYLQGGWTVAAGATLNIADGGNKFLNGVTLTNQGTIAVKTGDTLYFQNGANLANQGKLDLQADSTLLFNGGTVGSFVNTGLITKSAGTGTSTIGNNLGFDNQGVVNVASGTIRLPDNFTNNGTLSGTGAFTTNLLTNAAHVAPGGSPGALTLNGNFAQTATGSLDMELASSTSFDTFLINGTSTLGGTLALSCVQSCALHDGDVFVILNSTGTLSGTFASVTALNFGSGFQYDVSYDYGADLVKLEVVHAGIPSPVPEPESWALLMAGLVMVGTLARRRAQAS